MSEALPVLPDLRQTIGYLVADVRGRVVGRVECAMYGTARDIPDALSVRSGFLSRRRRLVPAGTIERDRPRERRRGPEGRPRVDSRVSLETRSGKHPQWSGVLPCLRRVRTY